MELFEEIRREYEFGVGSIAGAAKKLGVHRRMVREAIASALPKPRKTTNRSRWKLGPAIDFINGILEADRKAPRKQRHTAHRIWNRMREELPNCEVGERSVRLYVHERKREMGGETRETFVPQSYSWGVEGQVDWYEAYAEVEGKREKVQVFCLRSMASGGAFHCVYPHATQQAFLEGHERAFHYFGGVFRKLRYDNLGSAVKKILRGYQREETARFIAFRSHWRFQAEFCNPGKGNEKGGVEGEVGYFRRNHWVPVPRAQDLEELNQQMLDGCHQDEHRHIEGFAQNVGAGMLMEREHLLDLASEGFDLAEISFPLVDGQGCVRVGTNHYSAPVRAGKTVQVKLYAAEVEIWDEGDCVARHQRCYDRHQPILKLEHYLDVLERKPGALAGSKPLEQQRRSGQWPPSFDTIWNLLMARQGKQSGTKQMIELLLLGEKHGRRQLQQAVESCLEMGCSDIAAVQHLLAAEQLQRSTCEVLEIRGLERYERSLPVMNHYDQLLVGGLQK